MNISKIDALCRKNNISRTILEERAGISNGALGKPAVADHVDQYKKIIESELKGK